MVLGDAQRGALGVVGDDERLLAGG